MTVLIINDEEWTASMIREDVNWPLCDIDEVRMAYDAAFARELISSEKIDIMLCDIEMPHESGIELLRWVREKGFDIECVFLTCHANFTYAQEAVRLNCQDYILMPARREEIEATLQKVVQRIRSKRGRQQLEQYGSRWIESQREEAGTAQGSKKGKGEIIRSCEQYIQKNLMDCELSVNMVADFCHLNPIYLNRIFRKEKETSVGQYIIRERMLLAAELLKDSDLNACTVAEKTGYRNYSYFSTAFKKFYGCSPQQYTENMTEQKETR